MNILLVILYLKMLKLAFNDGMLCYYLLSNIAKYCEAFVAAVGRHETDSPSPRKYCRLKESKRLALLTDGLF
jgi:hypothetical protein